MIGGRRTAGEASRPGRRRGRCLRPGGFTLLELIVANVVAVILLGALVIALRVTSRQHQQARQTEASLGLHETAVVSLIQRDLVNSRRMWRYPDGSGFVLSGYAGLDSRGGFTPTGALCRVHYRVTGGMLVRTEEPVDGRPHERRWSELVCTGVAAMDVERTDGTRNDPADPSAAPGGGQEHDRANEAPATPDRIRLVVRYQAGLREIREDLWLR